MPRKARAASCIVQSLSTNLTTQYRGLWITDRLLAETFNNFCRPHRRHGSNVPGPLEARRRASKRKNTNLAYGGGGAGQPIYDPAVMLGSSAKDQWWKKIDNRVANSRQRSERQNKEVVAPSLLPEWLFKPSIALTVSDSKDYQKHLLEEVSDRGDLEVIFGSRIQQARTFMDIQNVVEDMGVNLRQHPNLAQIAFRPLLRFDRKTEEYDKLEKALYDPLLHPPGSSNHLTLLRYFCSHPLSRKLWKMSTFPSLLKAIELGLISANDLQEIISLIPDIHRNITPTHPNKEHPEWHRILSAIEQSRVLHLQDLDKNMLSQWFQRIKDDAVTDLTCFLLWKLRHYSGRSDLDLACDLTTHRLRDIVANGEDSSARFLRWLTDLPVDLRGSVVIQATFEMVSAAQDGDSLAQDALERWSSMLPSLGSEEMLEVAVDKTSWSKVLTIPCSLTPPHQLLSVIWIMTRLWAYRPDAASQFATTGLRDDFEDAFTNMTGVEQFDHVSRIVWTLDLLPLPKKDQIFPFLQHFSAESLIKLLGNEKYLDGLKACFKLEYAQLRDDTFAWVGRHKYPEVMTPFAETINTDLEEFQAMAQTLILKSNENFKIVKRLLDYNMKFKFALLRSWPSSSPKQNLQDPASEDRSKAILATVERLTMTFAVSPVISPRSSFRHVHKMYLFLHKCGAPVNPIIARALWHAGVTRYGQTGAPKEQVKWCLQKVREIEGDEVAGRLLWSAGFRREFVHKFADQFRTSQSQNQHRVSARQEGVRQGTPTSIPNNEKSADTVNPSDEAVVESRSSRQP